MLYNYVFFLHNSLIISKQRSMMRLGKIKYGVLESAIA